MKSLTLTVLVCLSLAVPLGLTYAPGLQPEFAIDGAESTSDPVPAGLLALTFPDILNTSQGVLEYPVVSRALILPDGISDMFLKDMNGDGLDDLVASVYASNTICIFYRGNDAKFETYPSLNITTDNHPFKISFIDVFGSGDRQIVALERGTTYTDTRFVIYNLTSDYSYEIWPDHSTYSNASEFVVGNLSSDAYPDLAVVCRGSNPQVEQGVVEVFFGPDFGTFRVFMAGWETDAISPGDFDDDGQLEIAVSNSAPNDTSVMLFRQPFQFSSTPYAILTLDSAPSSICSGRLDGDSLDDLAVATSSPAALHFFHQSLGLLPSVPDYNISLVDQPTSILARDMNDDTYEDLLVLSASGNQTFGHYQRGSLPLWDSVPDFRFPVSGCPRAATVGDMDGDGLTDLAVAGARSDWSGPSLALYPGISPTFSNSNATAWLDAGSAPSMIATGDINGDDVQDLITIDPVSSVIGYMYTFQGALNSIPLGFVPGDLMVADLDLDGINDIVAVEKDGPSIEVVMGSLSFPGASYELLCGGSVTDASLGDFNSDGFLDLVAATAETSLVLFNNTRASVPFSGFTHIESTPPGVWSVTVGDYNSDGMADIAYTKPVRTIVIMLQDTTVWFGPSSPMRFLTHSAGSDFTNLWCGDVTGDGKTDIVASRQSDPALYLFDQDDFEVAPHPYMPLPLPVVPRFVSITDVTDDGYADVIAIFPESDLVYLYRQESGFLPNLTYSPSMVFVPGADPSFAVIGDGTGDNRGDLLVNDLGSHSVSAWAQINFAPVAHAGGPYLARQGDLLQINGTVETGTSEIPYMEYFWDFGDGNISGWVNEVRPAHNYTDVGAYNLQMTARDPVGLMNFSTTTVDVQDSYPHTSFSWSPTNISEGRNVTFVDETWSFDPVVRRSWNVDGSPMADESQFVMRFEDGNHSVVLEVEDEDGTIVTVSEIIEVHPRSPDLNLTSEDVQPYLEGYSASFTVAVDEWHSVFDGSSWVQEPVDPIVLYEWDFSNVPGTFVPDVNTPNSAEVTHVFSASVDAKVYRVVVRVTDSDGEQNITSIDVWVEDIGPIAGISLTTTDPQEGVPFGFRSVSMTYDGIVSWAWRLEYPNWFNQSWTLDDRAMELLEFSDLQDGNYTMYLTVSETDGDSSSTSLSFLVRAIPPFVELNTTPVSDWTGYFQEFFKVEFVANASGLDSIVSYEWDFSAGGAEFIPDLNTTSNNATHEYLAVGNYTAKVRVTDSGGQSTIERVDVDIRHKVFKGTFDNLMRVTRNEVDTSIVTFDFAVLLYQYPDVVHVSVTFGDGNSTELDLPPNQPITHTYALGTDYMVSIRARDDDGYSHVFWQNIWNRPPEIVLFSPEPNGVIRSGTPILFLINPGSTELYTAFYSVDNSGWWGFADLYRIDTEAWPNWPHEIQVVARDYGGNIVRYNTTIIVDDIDPFALLSSSKTKVFGGDKLNISIMVDDPNVDTEGVVLFVRFQGESVYSTYGVKKAENGSYYKVLELPSREGEIDIYIQVTDKAGNSFQTQVYVMTAKLHFITVAWPYMLTAAMLAVLGTAGYFMREQKIAIDEVFVIYKDGRMITHSTRRLKPGMDDHVLGGMLVAIQDFVRESFKDITSFKLRRLEFGEKSVLVEKGEHVYLAVLLHGQTSRKIALKMQKVVAEIEQRFGPQLKDWDGDLEKMRGVGEPVKKLYSKMPMFPGKRSRND